MIGNKRQTGAGYSTSRQGGFVLISAALLLMVLLGFAALGVDVGMLYSARAAQQRSADAAALAGAFSFVTNPFAPQPETARAHAVSTAIANEVFGEQIGPEQVTVTVDVGNARVHVSVTRSEGLFFAKVLGRDEAQITVEAAAEASQTAGGSYCTKPFFLPNTILGEPDLTPCEACDQGQVLIGEDGMTSYASAIINSGQLIRIKPSNPQNALAPGQFYALRLPGSTGGDDYRSNIAHCAPSLVACAQRYFVEPGNMIGPTGQGIRELLGESPDTFESVGVYSRADGTNSDTSRQLITVPVWDTCGMEDFCPGEELPETGANLGVEVIGFAMLFVEGMHGNDVMAYVINVAACSGEASGTTGGSGAISGGEIGPFALPVRLVRTL